MPLPPTGTSWPSPHSPSSTCRTGARCDPDQAGGRCLRGQVRLGSGSRLSTAPGGPDRSEKRSATENSRFSAVCRVIGFERGGSLERHGSPAWMRVPGTASPFAFRCPAHQSETPLVGPAQMGGSCVSRHANVCSESASTVGFVKLQSSQTQGWQ